ncbi:MAG TPA: hypothetical protein VM431_11865 [Phycisphaerae bacterium]|nr:hypothetical protein [Phycisphaerae bacterium]
MEIVRYKGWGRNVRLANDRIELIATLDVGPRIIHLAVPGGKNVMKNYTEMLGKSGEREWMIRGGHRLWIAPEHPVKSYLPDNGPVTVRKLPKGGIRLVPQPETPNGIQKEIDVFLARSKAHVRLVHRIRNIGRKAVELAPWALSVMAPGGTAVIGLPPRGSHPRDLLPNQHVVLWPYTDLGDARLAMGTRSILLRHRSRSRPQKIGLSNPEGWAAYAVHGCLFVKRFAFDPGAAYPDTGCNTELFTNSDMLEVESLGPLVALGAGKKVEHVEDWYLFPNVPPISDEADVDRHVRPLLGKAR